MSQKNHKGVHLVTVMINIVDTVIPALLGMDVIEKESMIPQKIFIRFVSRLPNTIDEYLLRLIKQMIRSDDNVRQQ